MTTETPSPLFDETGHRLVWDASAIACAQQDWARYRIEYNEGRKAAPNAEMICGTLWGEFRQWLALRRACGTSEEAPTPPQIRRWFMRHELREVLEETPPRKRNVDKATWGTVKETAVELAPEIWQASRPILEGCEVTVAIPLGRYTITGYLDIVTRAADGSRLYEETKLRFADFDMYQVEQVRHSTQLRTYEWMAWRASGAGSPAGGSAASDPPFLVLDQTCIYKKGGVVRRAWVPTIFRVNPERCQRWEMTLTAWMNVFEAMHKADNGELFSPEGQARWETLESRDKIVQAWRSGALRRDQLIDELPKVAPWDPRKERWIWPT